MGDLIVAHSASSKFSLLKDALLRKAN